jgi:SanA protein
MDEENARQVVAETKAPSTTKPRRRVRWRRRLIWLFLLTLGLPVVFVIYIQLAIKFGSTGKGFSRVVDIQGTHIGLVFGCDDKFENRDNLYFKYRMDATAELWHAGKLRGVIVSGDNRVADYNEPQKMRQALILRGVPDEKIVCDYAGLRTLDSVVRCQKVFGTNQVLMISQQFQNERAIYIANDHGMDAIAYHAVDVGLRGGLRTKLREWGARVKMWLDLRVLNTQPKHLGPQVILPF